MKKGNWPMQFVITMMLSDLFIKPIAIAVVRVVAIELANAPNDAPLFLELHFAAVFLYQDASLEKISDMFEALIRECFAHEKDALV